MFNLPGIGQRTKIGVNNEIIIEKIQTLIKIVANTNKFNKNLRNPLKQKTAKEIKLKCFSLCFIVCLVLWQVSHDNTAKPLMIVLNFILASFFYTTYGYFNQYYILFG